MDVKELVTEIVIDTPLIGRLTRPYIINDYFVLIDLQSRDNLIYLFDNKDFSYVTGMGHQGEGPDEITSLGEIVCDELNNRIFAADYGKMKISEYNLDSVLLNSDCLPQYKYDINSTTIPIMLSYANDTLCYACCITAEPGKHYQQSLVKWNMKSGTTNQLISGHPEIERKRIRYAISQENNLIAVSYDHHDLLALYDLQGNLKNYIYGPDWDNSTSNRMIYYYGNIIICNDRIIVGYSGNQNPATGNIVVPQLIVYDLDGNYIKTLKVDYNIVLFCYDPKYNRIIMALEDEIQFAYLDLDNVLI